MCSCVFFLVRFSRVFLSCFFWCLLVILLVVFFVFSLVFFPLCSGAFFRAFFCVCPFSFLYTFPLGGGPVFCRAFFVFFFVFFFWVFFIVLFSLHFFVLFLVFFFRVFFSCLGWHPRQTTIMFCILARAFFRVFSGGHY